MAGLQLSIKRKLAWFDLQFFQFLLQFMYLYISKVNLKNYIQGKQFIKIYYISDSGIPWVSKVVSSPWTWGGGCTIKEITVSVLVAALIDFPSGKN